LPASPGLRVYSGLVQRCLRRRWQAVASIRDGTAVGLAMARAVILAGGRGTRLRPYTISLPKPLMPIGDKPILEIIVGQLAAQGVEHITLAVNYQAEILRAYFTDGSKRKVRIDYSLETEPLGTMGPLKLISNLPDNFLVLNGDVLTDLNYAQLIRVHTDASALFTISAAARTQKIDFGVLEVDDNQRLCGFREKPSVPYLVSMGVYCLHRSVLDWIPAGRPFGFDHLVLELLAKKQPVRVVTHPGYWLDIGRPDDYEKATDDWPNLFAPMEP
jgi:NDP-mannose synthase